MKTQILLSLFTFALAPVVAQAEITWSGGASVRHLIKNNDDGLNTVTNNQNSSKSTQKQHQIRADINASEKGESLDWGVGVRTNTGSASSEWVSFQNNTDLAIGLENAYVRPHGEVLGGQGAVTIGRARTVIYFDSIGQGFLDKDNRWDGLGWTWGIGNFGLNAAQYVLGARNAGTFGASTFTETDASQDVASTEGGFGMLYSVQPYFKFELAEEVDGVLAVGYHWWQGTGGAYSNAVHGGTAGSVGNRNSMIMDNSRQLQAMLDLNLPMKLRFIAEYVRNKEMMYRTNGLGTGAARNAGAETGRKADRSMYALSLAYGKVKKASDWSVSYSYVNKGIASVINSFTNGNMPADNTGHLIDFKIMPTDGFSLGAKMELYKEKAKLGGDGLALISPNQSREQSQNRYEFVAGVAF